MGKAKYSNNAVGHLMHAVNPGDRKFALDDVSFFPGLGPDDYTFVSMDLEVIKISEIDVHSHELTVHPDDSIQGPHKLNDTVELRMTKELLDAIGDMGEY